VVTCRLPLVQYLRSCSFGYLQTAFSAVPKIMFVWCGYLQTAFGAVGEKNTRGHRIEARANELVDVVVHQLSHLMKNVLKYLIKTMQINQKLIIKNVFVA